jgi:hypothetical protein
LSSSHEPPHSCSNMPLAPVPVNSLSRTPPSLPSPPHTLTKQEQIPPQMSPRRYPCRHSALHEQRTTSTKLGRYEDAESTYKNPIDVVEHPEKHEPGGGVQPEEPRPQRRGGTPSPLPPTITTTIPTACLRTIRWCWSMCNLAMLERRIKRMPGSEVLHLRAAVHA